MAPNGSRGSARAVRVTPGDWRDHRHFVAVGDGRRLVCICTVTCEPDRRPARGEGRMESHEGVPRIGDRGTVRQVERNLARPGQFTLDREQADPDAHAGDRRSPAPRGDEQPIADGQDRRREALIAEHASTELAQRFGVAVLVADGRRARDAPAPEDVVGEHERARCEAAGGQRIQIRAVFGLERIDEGEIERPGEGRLGALRTPRVPWRSRP